MNNFQHNKITENKKQNGINLPMPIKQVGLDTPEDIVERHFNHLKSNGLVYFSTSNRIDPKKALDVDYVLLSNQSGLRILCTVDNYQYFKEEGVPSDSNLYSPKKYANEPKKHWFWFSKMEAIDANQCEKMHLHNAKTEAAYGNVESYISQTKRLQTFYFTL